MLQKPNETYVRARDIVEHLQTLPQDMPITVIVDGKILEIETVQISTTDRFWTGTAITLITKPNVSQG